MYLICHQNYSTTLKSCSTIAWYKKGKILEKKEFTLIHNLGNYELRLTSWFVDKSVIKGVVKITGVLLDTKQD